MVACRPAGGKKHIIVQLCLTFGFIQICQGVADNYIELMNMISVLTYLSISNNNILLRKLVISGAFRELAALHMIHMKWLSGLKWCVTPVSNKAEQLP